MAEAAEPEEINFECKLHEIEMNHTIDVSKFMSSLQDYEDGQQIISKSFNFANLTSQIIFKPKALTHKGYCSIYIRLIHGEVRRDEDIRKVFVEIKCGPIDKSFSDIVSKFGKSGWGYPNFLSHLFVTKYPLIQLSLKINHDPQFVAPKTLETTFQSQHVSLYELSKSEGDIILEIVTKNDDQDNDGLSLKPPPLKKRKLNDNKNSNDENNENDEDDDIEVLSKINEMSASSVILKSSSAVFNNILSNNMMERKEKKIRIYAKSINDVDNMIYFMCTNKLRDNANALNIIELADFYQMERLKFQCINKMIKSISVDNFVEIVNIFDKYSIPNGYHLLIEFGKRNLEQLKKNDKFDQISHAFKMSALGMVQY